MAEPSESRIRELCEAGDLDDALTVSIECYGAELYGFLIGLAKDRTQADDAFAATCERIWRGLAAFRWDSSLRVWAYRVARNEFLRGARAVARSRRQIGLSDAPSAQLAVDKVRRTTPAHEQSAIKDRFAALRATLPPEDHMLLGLRIDRRMSWLEIADVLGSADPVLRKREAAALRKRFERLKDRLRAAIKDV